MFSPPPAEFTHIHKHTFGLHSPPGLVSHMMRTPTKEAVDSETTYVSFPILSAKACASLDNNVWKSIAGWNSKVLDQNRANRAWQARHTLFQKFKKAVDESATT